MTDFPAPTIPDPGALALRAFRQRQVFTALLDPAGVVLEVNAAIEARGFTRDQFLGRHIADSPYFVADSTWHETWRARLAEVAHTRASAGYDDAITTTDGQVRYAEATVSPLLDADGHLEYVVVEAEDTTERLQAELALREGERRFHDLLEALPAAAWSLDSGGECDFVNRRWLDELGAVVLRPDGSGTDWAAIIHPDDRAAFDAQWAQARAAAVSLAGRYRVIGVTGAARAYDVRLAPVLGDDGTVARWSGVAVERGDEPTPRS